MVCEIWIEKLKAYRYIVHVSNIQSDENTSHNPNSYGSDKIKRPIKIGFTCNYKMWVSVPICTLIYNRTIVKSNMLKNK